MILKSISLLILGLVTASCSSGVAPQVFSEAKGTIQGNVYAIDYGVQKGTLAYVVIRTWKMDSKQKHPKVQGALSVTPNGVGQGYQTLVLPNGVEIKLANSNKIFECSDTVLYETKLDITLTEWKKFLESDPFEYSIKALYERLNKPVPKVSSTKAI